MQVCVGVNREAGSEKQEILRSCKKGAHQATRRVIMGDDNQIVTSPSCSAMSFTFGSSSAGSSLFPPAAAAKLKVDRMLATGLITARGEGGRELSLRVRGDRGAPLRSTPWRELVRDMECWPARSFVASRSLSRRSAMTFSLAVTSTGLETGRPCQRAKFEWREKTRTGRHQRG